MNEMALFRERLKKTQACAKYRRLFDAAETKQDYMNIALTPQGADVVLDGIQFKWGLSAKFIEENFADYINGKYVYNNPSGYTSEMYCNYWGDIQARTSMLVLINHSGTVTIPRGTHCTLLIAANSPRFRIRNQGVEHITMYGEDHPLGKKHQIEHLILVSSWWREDW